MRLHSGFIMQNQFEAILNFFLTMAGKILRELEAVPCSCMIPFMVVATTSSARSQSRRGH